MIATTEICASFREKALTWEQVRVSLIRLAKLTNPKLTKREWSTQIYLFSYPWYKPYIDGDQYLLYVDLLKERGIDHTLVQVGVIHNKAGVYVQNTYVLTTDGLFWEQSTFPNEITWQVYKAYCLAK